MQTTEFKTFKIYTRISGFENHATFSIRVYTQSEKGIALNKFLQTFTNEDGTDWYSNSYDGTSITYIFPINHISALDLLLLLRFLLESKIISIEDILTLVNYTVITD